MAYTARATRRQRDAIKIIRIINSDEKIIRGRSTQLILDDNYRLLGMIRLVDLLESIRHLRDTGDRPCELGKDDRPVSDLVIPFPDSVSPDNSILEALDIMMAWGVSEMPVKKGGQFVGMIQLSDVFNKVAAILFDAEIREEEDFLAYYAHL